MAFDQAADRNGTSIRPFTKLNLDTVLNWRDRVCGNFNSSYLIKNTLLRNLNPYDGIHYFFLNKYVILYHNCIKNIELFVMWRIY